MVTQAGAVVVTAIEESEVAVVEEGCLVVWVERVARVAAHGM